MEWRSQGSGAKQVQVFMCCFSFHSESIELLEKEFQFWHNNRSVEVTDRQGQIHRVAQYRVEVGEPRPESWR